MIKRLLLISTILVSVLIVFNQIRAANQRIAFIGDSYTYGVVDAGNHGYAGRVADYFDYDEYRLVGYTFPSSITAFNNVAAYEPDIIVIELGIHIISGLDVDTQTDEEIRTAVGNIMDLSLGVTDRVYYVLIPWRFWGAVSNARAQYINAIIEGEASQRGIITIDIYDDLEQCGFSCIGWDGTHPNEAGHQIIADRVIDALLYRQYLPIVRGAYP